MNPFSALIALITFIQRIKKKIINFFEFIGNIYRAIKRLIFENPIVWSIRWTWKYIEPIIKYFSAAEKEKRRKNWKMFQEKSKETINNFLEIFGGLKNITKIFYSNKTIKINVTFDFLVKRDEISKYGGIVDNNEKSSIKIILGNDGKIIGNKIKEIIKKKQKWENMSEDKKKKIEAKEAKKLAKIKSKEDKKKAKEDAKAAKIEEQKQKKELKLQKKLEKKNKNKYKPINE